MSTLWYKFREADEIVGLYESPTWATTADTEWSDDIRRGRYLEWIMKNMPDDFEIKLTDKIIYLAEDVIKLNDQINPQVPDGLPKAPWRTADIGQSTMILAADGVRIADVLKSNPMHDATVNHILKCGSIEVRKLMAQKEKE